VTSGHFEYVPKLGFGACQTLMIGFNRACLMVAAALLLLVSGCGSRADPPEVGAHKAGLSVGLLVGPELPVDDPFYTPNARAWVGHGVAWNGSAYLVVASTSATNTLAWRLSASAQPLDPLPFSLPGAGPAASNGADYLIVYTGGGLKATRVSGAGTVLDPSGLAIASTVSGTPAVASNGSDYFVVWTDTRNGNNDIYGARVGVSGNVLDSAGIAISTAAGTQDRPAMAWDGAHYVVVWQDARTGNNDIYLARVSSAGSVVDAQGVAIASGSFDDREPGIASDGTNSLVVWDRNQSGVYGARVSQAGGILDAAAIAIAHEPGPIPTLFGRPVVTWNGSSFVTYYSVDPCGDAIGFEGKRVSSAGVVLSSPPAGGRVCFAYGIGYLVGAAGSGRHLRLGKSGNSNSLTQLEALAVASDGASLGSWRATAAADQQYPRLTHDGARYFIVWRDGRDTDDATNSRAALFGARINADGTTLDRAGIRIDPGGRVDRFAIGSNRSGFLVTAAPSGPLRGFRVDRSGSVLDANGFQLKSYIQTLGAVHSNGSDYLVTWTDTPGQTGFVAGLVGRRASAAGALLDTADLPILPQPATESHDAVWNGTNYLFVWNQANGVFAARVNAAGVMQGSPVSIAPDNSQAAVAWDGANHLVVWASASFGVPTLLGTRISPSGSVLDGAGFPIASARANQAISFKVAWNGKNHIVVFTTFENSRATGSYAIRVSPSGSVIDSAPTPLPASQALSGVEAIASLGDGRVLVAYSYFDASIKYRAQRIALRLLTECDSGSCELGDAGDAADAGSDSDGDSDAAGAGGNTTSDASSDDGVAGSSGGGSAGNVGSGGAGATAGMTGRGGRDGGPVPPDESGCSGCKMVSSRSSANLALVSMLLALLTMSRRRGASPVRYDVFRKAR
jgi:hypothetical protein